MPLPDDFQFNQNNLQDYADCPRRFQLRHLLRQEWPAIQTEPIVETENLIELGQNFHRLVYQNQAGISQDEISKAEMDPELGSLWQNFIKHGPNDLPEKKRYEFTLSVPFAGFRLIAKYDLLVFYPGSKVVIFDWKTSRRQPKQEFMLRRMQTKVYPLVLALANYSLGKVPKLDLIEMIYWYPYFPTNPMSFKYSSQQQQSDQRELESMLREIQGFREPIFPLTMDRNKCKFCVYRSLCNRGDKAGDVNELENLGGISTEIELDLDFEKIEEIEF